MMDLLSTNSWNGIRSWSTKLKSNYLLVRAKNNHVLRPLFLRGMTPYGYDTQGKNAFGAIFPVKKRNQCHFSALARAAKVTTWLQVWSNSPGQ